MQEGKQLCRSVHTAEKEQLGLLCRVVVWCFTNHLPGTKGILSSVVQKGGGILPPSLPTSNMHISSFLPQCCFLVSFKPGTPNSPQPQFLPAARLHSLKPCLKNTAGQQPLQTGWYQAWFSPRFPVLHLCSS